MMQLFLSFAVLLLRSNTESLLVLQYVLFKHWKNTFLLDSKFVNSFSADESEIVPNHLSVVIQGMNWRSLLAFFQLNKYLHCCTCTDKNAAQQRLSFEVPMQWWERRRKKSHHHPKPSSDDFPFKWYTIKIEKMKNKNNYERILACLCISTFSPYDIS